MPARLNDYKYSALHNLVGLGETKVVVVIPHNEGQVLPSPIVDSGASRNGGRETISLTRFHTPTLEVHCAAVS